MPDGNSEVPDQAPCKDEETWREGFYDQSHQRVPHDAHQHLSQEWAASVQPIRKFPKRAEEHLINRLR
jgi:hypothetical protein